MADDKDLIVSKKPVDELVLVCDPLLPVELRGVLFAVFAASLAGFWQAITLMTALGTGLTGGILAVALGSRTVTIDRRRREVREELVRIPGLAPMMTRHELKGGERCSLVPVTRRETRSRHPINVETIVTGYRVCLVLEGGQQVPLMMLENMGAALNQRDAIEAFLSGADANPAAHPAYSHPPMPTPAVQRGAGKGICRICGTDMRTEWVSCPKCETPHHESCWKYNGGCATFGCRRSLDKV